MKFSDITWGNDDAKGDINLSKYFFEFSKFEKIENGSCRYIIGRKGTGKTAIIEKMQQSISADPLSFYSTLTLKDFPLRDLKDLRDKSYQDKSQFVPIWQFLIYTEIAKLVLQDESSSTKETTKVLHDFLKINNLNNDIGFSETIKKLHQSNSKVSIFINWLTAETSKTQSSEEVTQVHYNKVVKLLENKLCALDTECEFWIFIDELDEGYKAGDTNLRLLLLALLRAVENSSLKLNSYLKFRPLLVLRSDIFDSLEDNDLNKLDDYIIRLKWSSEDTRSDRYALKEVISARIRNSLPNCGPMPWEKIVQDKDGNLPDKTSTTWKYIANRTYERPRDIIKFLKYCSEVFASTNNSYQNKLTFQDVKKAEDKYSDWLYKELRDELQAYLPCWRETFQCLTSIGKGKFPKSELDKYLKDNHTIMKWMSDNHKETNDIIELLFNFGILGNLDGSRWLFKYKDEDLSWNENMDLIIHFGLHKKLRISKP